ncbi:GAF and ANTAR domain-containing protein [Saxibacter everestensis]|uniref:GAF and ANTAR domain-containing protein n=1 Tax=Saxibacter everestensis TaxID=2909229 RepID=A0ABY8QVQ3_9MICO|nr:GAF and ANTAR domain-containing protein [Brevibacteriaceae bacterium ZFBP1038]
MNRQAYNLAHKRITAPEGGLQRLCAPFVTALPITGAAVSASGSAAQQSTLCASDSLAARLDELQFDLGEGPSRVAMASGHPVLIPDTSVGSIDWPMFGTAVQETPAAAVFAFPLALGGIRIGVVSLYRSTPGTLAASQIADAGSLATAVAWQVLPGLLLAESGESSEFDDVTHSRREVHQATGMILVQLDTTVVNAFLLLQAHAFSNGRTVDAVARDVVLRRIDFAALPD